MPNGMATSYERPTFKPKKPRSVTPMTVNGTRSSVSVRPMTSGAPPKCRFQNA